MRRCISQFRSDLASLANVGPSLSGSPNNAVNRTPETIAARSARQFRVRVAWVSERSVRRRGEMCKW